MPGAVPKAGGVPAGGGVCSWAWSFGATAAATSAADDVIRNSRRDLDMAFSELRIVALPSPCGGAACRVSTCRVYLRVTPLWVPLSNGIIRLRENSR